MNNKTHLTGYNYQNKTMPYAALTDQAKAALLTSKQAFISHLQRGDVVEGTLVQYEDKLFLKELHTGLLLRTSLVDEQLLGHLLQWEVKGFEGEKLLLALKEQLLQGGIGDKNIIDQALEELEFSKRPGMKAVVENFTRFELPLLKPSIASTYGLTQVTKLPIEVLLNILERYQEPTQLNNQMAYKHIEKYDATKLMENMTQMLTASSHAMIERGMSKEQVLTKFLEIFLKATGKDNLNPLENQLSTAHQLQKNLEQNIKNEGDLKSFVKAFVDQELPVDEILKRSFKLAIGLSLEDVKEATKQAGGLKNTILFKEDEVIKMLIKEIKEHTFGQEHLEKLVGEVEEQLIVSQKLKEEGHYYTFPFMSKLGEAQGKVYFYKPYKSKVRKDKSLYTVVALDMPMLKQVEIHIYQVEKTLKIGFYIDSEEARKVIEKEGYRLVELLQNLGYHINSMSFSKKVEAEYTSIIAKSSEMRDVKGFDYQV